jgi:hypothetical protein
MSRPLAAVGAGHTRQPGHAPLALGGRRRRRPGHSLNAGALLLDDHLLRDLVVGELPAQVDVDAAFASTNLWLVRLTWALARRAGGALSGPVAAPGDEVLDEALDVVESVLEAVTTLPMRELVFDMARRSERHRRVRSRS